MVVSVVGDIVGIARVKRSLCRMADVFGRIKIRFAQGQRNTAGRVFRHLAVYTNCTSFDRV